MKSNVSDCLEIMASIYRDATMKCSADVSDLRDLDTLRSRVNNEGISFLTITLPAFAKAFERSLAIGRVDPTSFPGFRLVKGGVIPAFLQGILGRIFDVETGRLRDEDPPDGGSSDVPILVESVRQLCLTFKKVELQCTPAREYAALENFKNVEQEFSKFWLPDEELEQFARISHMLWGGMLLDFDPSVLRLKHGPGATAEHVSGNRKYEWLYWYDRLEPFFPLIGNAYPIGVAESLEEIEKVTIVSKDQEFPVRVVLVPKTLKTPRVIAIEPSCMQFAQQGVRDYLYRKIEGWKFSSGHVNFTDQEINQSIALASSRDGRYATIDLSDASDRVPLLLVKKMLEFAPELLECILACRSESAELPTGEVIGPLQKFASMGSALCFYQDTVRTYTNIHRFHDRTVVLTASKRVLVKKRVEGDSPFGVSLSWANLSPRQIAIAGALGISASPKR